MNLKCPNTVIFYSSWKNGKMIRMYTKTVEGKLSDGIHDRLFTALPDSGMFDPVKTGLTETLPDPECKDYKFEMAKESIWDATSRISIEDFVQNLAEAKA